MNTSPQHRTPHVCVGLVLALALGCANTVVLARPESTEDAQTTPADVSMAAPTGADVSSRLDRVRSRTDGVIWPLDVDLADLGPSTGNDDRHTPAGEEVADARRIADEDAGGPPDTGASAQPDAAPPLSHDVPANEMGDARAPERDTGFDAPADVRDERASPGDAGRVPDGGPTGDIATEVGSDPGFPSGGCQSAADCWAVYGLGYTCCWRDHTCRRSFPGACLTP